MDGRDENEPLNNLGGTPQGDNFVPDPNQGVAMDGAQNPVDLGAAGAVDANLGTTDTNIAGSADANLTNDGANTNSAAAGGVAFPGNGGGIYSTEELTIESDAIPENMAPATGDNQSRVAAAFAKTDASQNAINGAIMSTSSEIPSSATGDIKLAKTKGEKKFNFKVAGVIVGVVAVAAIVGIVMSFGGHKDPLAELANNTEDALYQFANYYLFGIESKKKPEGKYDSEYEYAITKAIQDNDVEFLNKAKNYLEKYKKLYREGIDENIKLDLSESSDDTEPEDDVAASDGIIEEEKSKYEEEEAERCFVFFDFLYNYSQIKDYEEDELLTLYLQSGYDSIQENIKENYGQLSNTVLEEGKKYITAKMEYDLVKVDLFEVYDRSGCIHDDEVDPDCEIDRTTIDMGNIIKVTAQYYDAMGIGEIIDRSVRNLWVLVGEDKTEESQEPTLVLGDNEDEE